MRMLGVVMAAGVLGLAMPVDAQEVDCGNAMTQAEFTYCAEQDWLARYRGQAEAR